MAECQIQQHDPLSILHLGNSQVIGSIDHIGSFQQVWQDHQDHNGDQKATWLAKTDRET